MEGIQHIIERKTRIESRVQHVSELPHIKALSQSHDGHDGLHHQHHPLNPNDLKQAAEAIRKVMTLVK